MNPVITQAAKSVTSRVTAKVSKIKWDQAKIKRRNHYLAAQGVKDSLRFVVTRARTKELQRGKNKPASRAGERPVVRTRRALSRMKFEYSYKDLTGVAGPIKIDDRDPFTRNATTAPNALEYGGQYTIREHWQQFGRSKTEGRWVRTNRKNSRDASGTKKRKRKITISARPFMKPALEHEIAVGNVVNSFKDKWSV
jgi:hypothetical protein